MLEYERGNKRSIKIVRLPESAYEMLAVSRQTERSIAIALIQGS